MASNVYLQQYADGSSVLRRRSTKQGRKPSGLAKPELVRLRAEDSASLDRIGERLGYLWNRNEFIRSAVRRALEDSVYIELLKP